MGIEGGEGDEEHLRRSGGQTLATAGAARCENLAAGLGGEAGAETVATLANNFRGLIGAFHGTFSAFAAGCRAIDGF
jgi:hypothetical protein